MNEHIVADVSTCDGIPVVRVSGTLDSRASGYLYDVLVDSTGKGNTKLIVDLSGVQSMTRAGVRGLVVAARRLAPPRGGMRICGADPSIEALLQGLGHNHLLKCDPTIQASMAKLSDRVSRNAGAPTTVVTMDGRTTRWASAQLPVEGRTAKKTPPPDGGKRSNQTRHQTIRLPVPSCHWRRPIARPGYAPWIRTMSTHQGYWHTGPGSP